MYPVNDLSKGENSDVKLPLWSVVPMRAAYQQGIVYVLLDDPFLVGSRVLQHFPDLAEILEDYDAFPTIGVLARLADPYGRLIVFEAVQKLHELGIIQHISLGSQVVGHRQEAPERIIKLSPGISFTIFQELSGHVRKRRIHDLLPGVHLLEVALHGCEQMRLVGYEAVSLNLSVDLILRELVDYL